MLKCGTDVLIILFFLLGTIAGASLDRAAVKFEREAKQNIPKQTQCKIMQGSDSHWFNCEVFNDYAAIKM